MRLWIADSAVFVGMLGIGRFYSWPEMGIWEVRTACQGSDLPKAPERKGTAILRLGKD
jgi:hypothetical protein